MPFESLLLFDTAKDQHDYAVRYAAYHLSKVPRTRETPPPSDKIRIAYVSADFGTHAVLQLLIGVLESHDRSKFHVTAVALTARPGDKMRERANAAVDRFLVISDPDDVSAAAFLRAQDFDIAIDLQGFTRNHRMGLFVLGIAPLQVSYLGYPATLGGSFIDYILADRHIVPEDARRYYTEQVVYLPDSYQPNDNRRAISPRTSHRSDHGLPDGAIVFCCFNNPHKILPPVFDAWVRILKGVPGSVLWMGRYDSETTQRLRCEAEARGLNPDRIIFAAKEPLIEDHLARLAHADLALDTVPYNAHATNADALWAGVPVVTCTGASLASRVGASLLHAVGLPELLTASLDAYEKLAIALARDPARLAAIRAKLATRAKSPLFDTARMTRHIEAAFETMHARRLRGLPPEAFSVPPKVEV